MMSEKETNKKDKQEVAQDAVKEPEVAIKLEKEEDGAYMRLLAEFDNFKKRMEKDQQYWLTNIKKGFLVNLLPVLDDFELAQKHVSTKQTSEAETKGIALVYKKLMQLLEKEGLKVMQVKVGDAFDALAHEAIATLPNEEPAQKGSIVEVVHKGYLLDDTTIRFAKVIVNA